LGTSKGGCGVVDATILADVPDRAAVEIVDRSRDLQLSALLPLPQAAAPLAQLADRVDDVGLDRLVEGGVLRQRRQRGADAAGELIEGAFGPVVRAGEVNGAAAGVAEHQD